MKERKNIDKFFQESFRDFEATPPESAWPEIESRLKGKKKRRIIPFWWKLGGVAAALLIGSLIIEQAHRPDIEAGRKVVVGGKPVLETHGHVNARSEGPQVAVDLPKDSAGAFSRSAYPENGNAKKDADKKQSVAAIDNEVSAGKMTAGKKASLKNPDQRNSARESEKNKGSGYASAGREQKKHLTQNSAQLGESENNGRNAYASVAKAQKKRLKKKGLSHKNGWIDNPNVIDEAGTVTERSNRHLAEEKKKAIAQASPDNTKSGTAQDADPTKDPGKASTENFNNSETQPNAVAAIKEKDQNPKKDSTAVAAPNALEELLREKENKKLVTNKPERDRWQITSNIAPVYFGSTSNGSPIDSTFAGNSKGYGTNLTYGLGVNYAVNKRFIVRAAVNKLTFSYNTNDVAFSAGYDDGRLENVTPSDQSGNLHFTKVAGKSTASTTVMPEETGTYVFDGRINQKMGYIEIPVELSYAVIDKRFGISVIGGVSTLFLNENSLTITSDGLETDLGKASNLNKTHFSSNLGLGLKYRIYKAIEAHFEPTFKYQINTFSRDSGDFKPYFFGLYTGLSYKF